MSDLLIVSLIILGYLFLLLFATTGYALRKFSRTKMQNICLRHNLPQRFGDILQRRVEARLFTDTVVYLLVALDSVLLFQWRGWGRSEFSQLPAYLQFATETFLYLTVTFLIVILLPWTLSRVRGEQILFRFWPSLQSIMHLGTPNWKLIQRADVMMHRLMGLGEPPSVETRTVLTELQTVVEEGQREGIIEPQATTMIHRVIDLKTEDVCAIMTPRTEMICLSADATLNEARITIHDAGHSRIPLVGATRDEIVGLLYAKDLLKVLGDPLPEFENEFHSDLNEDLPPLQQIAREPYFIPETTSIITLMDIMRKRQVHVAIVVDEYGGVSGLVSLEDILEEIVGEIEDEYDDEEDRELVTEIRHGLFKVDARMNLDDVNEQLGTRFPGADDYDTLAGFLCKQMGRIPDVSEELIWEDSHIRIETVSPTKILDVTIETGHSPSTPFEESA